ncbi:MAG: 3-phosphoshikimate 1-carboxyvinyltransferase [Bacteroidales bacterium]|nr:3-phosphoshikimate 1-carboxyvinyltransferase [Bacteroidales bacterium]MBN2758324.1 3-phosphoshikimate 1-carboxyvinyltransferase [Bacteroidales bacterium]
MIKKIKKSEIDGQITVPSSKSHFQRLLAGALLSKGKSEINFVSISNDTRSVIELIQLLGAKVEISKNQITIEGGFRDSAINLNVGESGLGLRLFTPIVALQNRIFKITGTRTLLNRPVDFIVESMKKFHVHIESDNGKLPLYIKGPLVAADAEIEGSFSSQLLTGLLMSLPLIKEDSKITVKNLTSKPYIDLTINTLKLFNIKIEHKNYKTFNVKGKQNYTPVKVNVEGDWSSAAFILVAAAISGEILVKGLNFESMQGDKNIIEVLKKCGAKVEIDNNLIRVKKYKLIAFEYDATETPDLFPPLVALAANCKGISTIHGVNRLIHKESNRANSLKSEFEKLGANIAIHEDRMLIEADGLTGNKVSSHDDHRIAMALTVAGLTASGDTEIEKSECVSKSWPSFFQQLNSIGAIIN